MFILALWALAASVRNYRSAGIYREKQVRAVLNSFSHALAEWRRASLSQETFDIDELPRHIRSLTITESDGTPFFPDFSLTFEPCRTTAFARIAEKYFAGADWNAIPVSSLTNDAARYIIPEPSLAKRISKDRASQIEIAWQMGADAFNSGSTNRARKIYRLIQSAFPRAVDINAFPVTLAARLEEIKLSSPDSREELLNGWLRSFTRCDFRDEPETRNAATALLRDAAELPHPKTREKCRLLINLITPQAGECCEFSFQREGKTLSAAVWLDASESSEWLRENWLPTVATEASNVLVRIIVHSPEAPAPVGRFVSTNVLGNVISIVPFDAASWEKKHKIRSLTQIILLCLLLLVLLALGVRALSLIRAESSLMKRQLNFVAAVSHELRTPIASVRALAETLSRGVIEKPGEQREYADLIISEGDRLARLVDNILDVSNKKGKRARFRRESVKDIVNSVIESLAPTDFSHKIRVCHGSDADIWCDAHAIERALHNLIDNAKKYSNGTIEVATRIVNGHVEISVRDCGVGIAKDEQEKIFSRFYRVGDELTREQPGAGLGLTIVKDVVEAHNGQIHVESAPGKGSKFTLRFREFRERESNEKNHSYC